jgi:hypothetical protein
MSKIKKMAEKDKENKDKTLKPNTKNLTKTTEVSAEQEEFDDCDSHSEAPPGIPKEEIEQMID